MDDDFMNLVAELQEEIQSNPEAVDEKLKGLTAEQLSELNRAINPYTHTVAADNKGYMAYSYTNLKEKFMRHLIITGMTGFIYRYLDEYYDEDHDLAQGKQFNKVDDSGVLKVVEYEDGSRNFMNCPLDLKKQVVKEFMDYIFEFNPNIHLKSSHKSNTNKKGEIIDYDRETVRSEMMNNPPEEIVDAVTHNVPVDTFVRYERFHNAHFESLRRATMAIHGDIPDLEEAFIFYDRFNTEDEAQKFKEKHEDDVRADIRVAQFGKWVFQGPWQENRERINFFSKNTQLLQSMIEKNEEDQKIGKELIKDRVTKRKIQNIKTDGPDDKGLQQFRDKNPAAVSHMGVEYIDASKALDDYEEDEDGCPMNAIEVPVFSIAGGGKEVKKSTMYSKAKAPTPMGGAPGGK